MEERDTAGSRLVLLNLLRRFARFNSAISSSSEIAAICAASGLLTGLLEQLNRGFHHAAFLYRIHCLADVWHSRMAFTHGKAGVVLQSVQ